MVVGTLVAFLAIFSIWVNRQALNTDNWVNTSDKLLQNEEVQARLSNYLADQLFENVDVQSELEATLPPRLAPLAGPAAGALRQLAPQVAQRALATPQFEGLWSSANRKAHESLLKILNDEGSAVSTAGGEVTLDLSALLSQIGGQLGGGIASKVPPDAGRLTILKSDELSQAQDATSLVRRLPIVLTLLALFFYGLAIYLAGPRRREALRSVGFGFLIAGVLALVLRQFAGNMVTDTLASGESVEPAIDAVWSIGTSLLRTVAVSAITFGALVVIAAWLAGPTRLATSLRRDAAPYLRERPGASYAVVGLVFLALVLWAPVEAFHKPIGLILLAVLMVLGTEALRRQAAAEFPDAAFGELGDRLRASVPGRSTAAPQAPRRESKIDQLERITALREKGALSEEQYEAAKAEVLGGPTGGPTPPAGAPPA
ncbi:MAG TPA: SHOCT domain-containing protein [Solirubrobacterales bacterium]|nr:SHOCT domain-containing protein [Solirubrobacterales bacterium]